MRSLLKAARRATFTLLWFLAPDYWSAGPRPDDKTVVHTIGPDPLRVLFFGGGPAVGYGVNTHELSMAGHLARRISRELARGIDLEVVTSVDLTAATAVRMASAINVRRFDAIVLVLGIQDGLQFVDERSWANDMRQVIASFTLDSEDPAAQPPILAITAPPASVVLALPAAARLVDRHIRRLNARLLELVRERPRLSVIPFQPVAPAGSLRHRDSDTYRSWADSVAPAIVRELADIRQLRPVAMVESARQLALERLEILDTEPEHRFDRITLLAQRYFKTSGAAISLVDRNRQWFKSRVGLTLPETSRDASLCDHTIRSTSGFIVPDVKRDRRFSGSDFANNGLNLRSYAGFPLESPEGERVGALCVFDVKPREFSTEDIIFLRELAHLAQEQLWLAPSRLVHGR